MKKKLLFLGTFLCATAMAFAQASVTYDTTENNFTMVSPLVSSSTTNSYGVITTVASYTQMRTSSIVSPNADNLNAKFEFDVQTVSGSVSGDISFDFRKLNGCTATVRVTVGGVVYPSQFKDVTAGTVSTYEGSTVARTTVPGTQTFTTTPTHIIFEILDLDQGTSGTYTSARLYGFRVSNKNVSIPSEAVLNTGNVWYHNYSPDTYEAVTSNISDGVFLEKVNAVATPSTTGNSSTSVAKYTKGASPTSYINFKMPGTLTTANQSSAIFKIRAYVPSTNIAPINSGVTASKNLKLILRDGGTTTGQLNINKTVTVFDQWQEYIFDFSGSVLSAASYSNALLSFDQPDVDLAATGNVYYLDAFQGPLLRTVWTGNSTSWTDPTNWSPSVVPSALTDVTIGTAMNQPVIDANQAFNSLIIEAGKSLTVNPGKVLTVAGSIVNSGSLILKSSTAGTASLISTASAAASNVTQERYLASNQRGWGLLSNPLDTTTFSAITSASNITLGTGFTGAYDSPTNTWSSTDASASFDTQKAYKVFITSPSNVTLSVSGTAINTVPNAISTVATKYYLVANPYTAPVSLVSILDASTNLSNSVSYYNPTKGSNGTTDLIVKKGGYDTIIVSGVAGSATDVILPPMGAIFVQASADGTINVPKTAIFTGTTEAYNHKTAQSKTAAAAALTLDIASNGVDYDKLQLQFKEAGTTGSNIDFGKLPNSVLDFYSINESTNMAISELELKEQTIPLGVSSTEQKSFTLKVAENSIPVGFDAVLVDNVANTNTVLAAGTTYNFEIDNSSASQGNARFAITLKSTGTLSVAASVLDSKIQLWPNPAHNQFNITNAQNLNDGASIIEISNVNGQMVHSQKSNPGTSTTIQTNSWAAGVYILKATNNGTQTTKKLIIQ